MIDTIPNPGVRYKWTSTTASVAAITIKTTDPHFVYGDNGFYYIGVYGYSSGNDRLTGFQVGAKTEDQTEILTEGIPNPGEVVKNNYQFFEYQLSSNNDVWFETDSKIWGNSPYLCISTDHKQPTVSGNHCTWKVDTVSSGMGSIIINKTDPNWKKTTYYIGVK